MNECVTTVLRGGTCGTTYASMGHNLSSKTLANATMSNENPAICAPEWAADEGTGGWLEGCVDKSAGHLLVSSPPGALDTSGYTGCEGWCTGRGYAWATVDADGACTCADLTVHGTTTEGCAGAHVKRLSPLFDQVITAGTPICYVHLQQPCATLPGGASATRSGWYNDALSVYGGSPATTESACQSRAVSYWNRHCTSAAPAYFYSNGANTLFCDPSHTVRIRNVLRNSTTTAINQSQLSPHEATARIATAQALDRASKEAVSAVVLTNTRACKVVIDTGTSAASGDLNTHAVSTLTLMGRVYADSAKMSNTLIAQINGKCQLTVDVGDTGCVCQPTADAGCEHACVCDDGVTQVVDLLPCVMGNAARATRPDGQVVPYLVPVVDTPSSTVVLSREANGAIGCDKTARLLEISTCADGEATAGATWETPATCPNAMSGSMRCPAG